MQFYNLNHNTIWKSLPWQTIKIRIFMMQKKIYKASKACKKSLLYKWQNKLLNCNEVKIIAIDTIFTYISKYYSIYNFEKYNINDKFKFFIFKYIFCEYKYNILVKNLLESIKQYIIYLCIKPEWEAKFEPIFSNDYSYQKKYIFQERLISFFNLINIKTLNKNIYKNILYNHYQVIIKYIDPKYIIDKFQSLPYISYCLQSWLDNNFIERFLYSENMIFEVNNLLLYELLYKVLCTGIDWFNLKDIEIESKSKIYSSSIYFGLYFNIYNNSFIYLNRRSSLLFNYIFISLGLNSSFIKFCNRKAYNNKIVYNLLESNISIINKEFHIHNLDFLSKVLLNQVKLIIYKKDLFGRWRAKKYLKLSNILLLFINKLSKFYQIFCFSIDMKILHYLRKKINILILIWLRKKYKKAKIDNYLLNENFINKNLLAIRENLIYDISILKFNR